MFEQPRQQQQDQLIAELQKRMVALEQENTLLKQTLADLSELEQRYRLLENCEHIFEGTISASNALLTIENFDEAVNTALQIIGEKLDSERVAVIANLDSPPDELPQWKMLYEWHSPHTVPQITHPTLAQGSYEEIKEWYALFSQSEGVSCLLEEMPEPFRGGQAELSVKAFHIVPIFVEGECWGVVGFDDCREAKRRSLAELAVLKTAAACIGSAIEGDRTRQALLRAEQERATQLEHINTELRQALDRLAESEERFRTLFELSSEGFNYVEFDPPYSVTLPIEEQCELYRRNLRVVKVNPAFAAMYGVDNPDDLIGLKITDVHVEDSEKNAAFFRAIVENGYRVRNIETEEIDTQGQLRYFLNSGVATIKDNYVVNGWGTQVDITELRQTQQALLHAEQERAAELAGLNIELQHSKTRLQDLIRTMSDWAWEIDAKGFYTYADEKVYKFLGYKHEELLGKTPFDLMPPAEAKRVAQEFRQIAAERKPFRKLENINITKDGRQVILETSGTPIFDLQGKFLGYRGVDSDITERKQAEKALQQSETCLAQKAQELQQTLDRLTESEERYRTLFELSSEGIYRFEVNPPVSTSLPLDEQCELAEQHWRVVEANQAFASQYGLSSTEEAIGFTFETSSQAGTENLREVNQALIANGYRIRNIQTEEMDVRGNRKYFLQSIVCDIEDGFIKGGWGMQADVTELRQAQQKLLQAAKEQAAKLESVNAVLHESVKQLSNEADTEAFLGYVLAEMARQVDAALVHLFRYDASAHTLTLHLTYLKGKLRQGTSNEECELFAAPFPADITPAFELMCQHRQFMTPEATPIPVEEFAWPGALEWLVRIQASDAAHLVLFVGDTPVGTMGLAFTDGKTLQKEDQPLVMALSQQCAIALRLSDLAERSRQAAIAREQQKAALERAAELESLNAALRRETRERCQAEEVIRSQNSALKHSLERLLQEPDIRGFLGALLDTLMTQLQGHAANIWLLQDDRATVTLWTAFGLGQLHTNPEETLLPYDPIPVDLVAQTILSVKAGWQQTIHYSGDDPRLPLPLQEFHKCDRICSVLTTPLRLGHHLLGWLTFATQEDLQQMPSDKVAFLEAIAHQATLALHLHHLAEEAKQAALAKLNEVIAREQEKAAQERAAELAKANHALRESLGSLATNPELDTFLGYMLLEMATQIDAAKNHLFLYDQSTHTLSLHIFVRDSKVLSKEANDFELFAQPIPADISPAWRLMIQQKSPLNLALEPDNPNFWSGTYEWHRAQGHQGVLCVPLILGEEPLGFLGLAFTAKAMLSPQEIELAQALAHQVTLAIQLTRLAEESRQAAILEERNRMAREIHDTLAQAFAGIGIQLQAATRFRTTNPDKAQIHCDRAHALAQTGLTEARRAVWALSQEGLEYSDLSASVTRIAEQLTAGTSLQAQIEVQGTPYSIEPEVGLNLLRIAQEALTNALRHAQAQTIQIQIIYEPSYVRLGVRDDGRGFDPQLPVKGFGLASMQQRVDHIGAQLLVSSQLGAGTEIAVILPMGD